MVQTVGNVDRTLFLAAVPSLTCCWEDPGQMLRTEWYCHQTVHTVVQHHQMKGVKRGLFVQCGCSFSSIDLVSLDLNLYSMIIFMWKSCGPNLRHYLWLVSYPNYIVLVPIVWNHFFLRARKMRSGNETNSGVVYCACVTVWLWYQLQPGLSDEFGDL